jgi:hypothetical protein
MSFSAYMVRYNENICANKKENVCGGGGADNTKFPFFGTLPVFYQYVTVIYFHNCADSSVEIVQEAYKTLDH